MRSVSVLVGALLGACGSAASATPVYLDCVLSTKDGPQKWTISLNEEASTITYTHALGTFTSRAAFTPDAVIWGDGDLKIDRVTLQFTRTLGEADEGKCAISKEKRAF